MWPCKLCKLGTALGLLSFGQQVRSLSLDIGNGPLVDGPRRRVPWAVTPGDPLTPQSQTSQAASGLLTDGAAAAQAVAALGRLSVVGSSTLSTHTDGQEVVLHLLTSMIAETNKVYCLLSQAWDGPSSELYGSYEALVVSQEGSMPEVRCALPLMTVEGPVDVQVSATKGRQKLFSQKTSVWYSSPMSASFDRHPYYAAEVGELLIRTNVTDGSGCHMVQAQVDGQNIIVEGARRAASAVLLEAADVPSVGKTVLKVDFRKLPVDLDTQVWVHLQDCQGNVLHSRAVRLIRVAKRRRGAVAVDHKRRTLIVDGRPFYSLAWFDMYLFYGVQETINSLRDMSRRGANSVVIYNLVAHSLTPRFKDRGPPGGSLPLSDSIKVLDGAAALGIKVHVYLVDLCDPITNGDSNADWAHLKEAVFALKDHPAVLSWYVADDASGPRLPDLYNVLREWDPYHLVSIAITGAGNIYNKRYEAGADLIMLETYEAYADGAYSVMNMFSRGTTTQFMPYITCGRAWTTDEDNAVITRQVFRSQFWHSIAAGTTGEVWFAYRNADGWNEPGQPLQATSGEVSFEVLDMAQALMTTEDWSERTAIKPVTVEGYHKDGSTVSGDRWSSPVRAKAFREESGCVTLVITNSYDQPMDVAVTFAHGTPGVYDAHTSDVDGLVVFEGTSLNRFLRTTNGRLTETLESLGSRVVRFNGTGTSSCAMPQAKPGLRISASGNVIQNPSFEHSAAYPSSPDDWDCYSTPPPIGPPDSSCYADTHVSRHMRHSGRFVTGQYPGKFMIRPKLMLESATTSRAFSGSVFAQSDQPMTLSVWQVHWPKFWLPFKDYATGAKKLASLELTEHWKEMKWVAQLTKEHHIYFTVDKPGVLWLDQAELIETEDPVSHLHMVKKTAKFA